MGCLSVISSLLFVLIKIVFFQYPVAVKTCNKCKHSFYLSKKDIAPKPVAAATAVQPSVEEPKDVSTAASTRSDGRRRTERIRREKPNYYDASAFIRKTKVSKLKIFKIPNL